MGENRQSETTAEVVLTDFDPDAEVKVVAAALYSASNLPDDQLLARADTTLRAGQNRATLQLRPPALAPGQFRWTFTLFADDQRRIAGRTVGFRVVNQAPPVYVDRQGRLNAGAGMAATWSF